ncbi:MAG: MBOAT family protein [Cytophagales bacterium]|nr:MAG: MBOAT family protein [Cytophagales bacterium]TAF60276.1 MAG: MBOAT family protein [Cytophagales bacterium]
MPFQSLSFLLFFAFISVLMWFWKGPSRIWVLLLGSAGLYASFRPAYLLVMLALIAWDYLWARVIDAAEGKKKRWLLAVGILANLSMLGSFKYMPFLTAQINVLFNASFTWPVWVLPVGLSFHTFQGMAYLVEVYRKNIKAEQRLDVYALYILFFPQLMAGPIERPQHLLPQIRNLASGQMNWPRFERGMLLLVAGFFRKLVVADVLGILSAPCFAQPQNFVGFPLFLSILCFSIQIYADFSGYTLMARGAAHTLGVRLSHNFKYPYFALSMQDFWKKWHISLSSWFKDYVYIPLGGSRQSFGMASAVLVLTFLLSGFWHGANWNFLLWGLWNALWILLERYLQLHKLPLLLKRLYVWTIVFYGWIFFKVSNLNDLLHCLFFWFRGLRHSVPVFFESLYGLTAYHWFLAFVFSLWLFVSESHYFRQKFSLTLLRRPFGAIVLYILIILSFGQLFDNEQLNFIYFEF